MSDQILTITIKLTKYILYILVFVFFSCSEETKKSPNSVVNSATDTLKDESSNIDSSQVLSLDEFNLYYKKAVQPVVFSEYALAYTNPDTLSKVKKTLKFNTSIWPIENRNADEWVQIKLGNDTSYILTKDVAMYSFISPKNNLIKYFVTEGDECTIMYKYNIDIGEFIDTLKIENFIPDHITQFNSLLWKNVDLLISMNQSGNCCGCSDNQIYLMDANDKLDIMFKTTQYIDDGEIQAGFESYVGIPLNPEVNDIVYSEIEYGGIYDENETPLLEEDGSFKVSTIKEETKFFTWDGFRILEKK